VRLKSTLITAVTIGLLAGSAVGVAAQDGSADPMAPSVFSGLAEGDGPPEFSEDPDTGLDRVVFPWGVTDSRASGTWTQLEDGARVEAGGSDYEVGSSSVRLAVVPGVSGTSPHAAISSVSQPWRCSIAGMCSKP
jgi:hypothetical protein